MDVFTLYVAQGHLSVVRSHDEAIIIDAHMPDCDGDVSCEAIVRTLTDYLRNVRVRGLVLTGLDRDHAHPPGVELILKKWTPDWVMYPTVYKETDAADEVFATIEREVTRRKSTSRALTRESVRLDKVDSRLLRRELSNEFNLELFSPHVEDMDSSNNSSIVLLISGRRDGGFRYLVTGDTEVERWERIVELFGGALVTDVLAAPHHGSKTGVHPKAILHASPHTVIISAGVRNQYGHPDEEAVRVYKRVASHVHATNDDDPGVCLLTRVGRAGIETHHVGHS